MAQVIGVWYLRMAVNLQRRAGNHKRNAYRKKATESWHLILLAAEGNGPAARIKAPLLEIVARDDANDDGPRLPHIRVWFDKVPQPKELIVLDGSAHAQFLFQTEQAERVMKDILTFLHSTNLPGRR